MGTDIVKVIGDLWPLASILFLTLCVLLFRKQLGGLLERLSKFQIKRWGTEISAETSESKKVETDERPEFVSEIVSEEKPTTEAIEQGPKPEPATSGEWAREMILAYISRDMSRGEEAFDKAQKAEPNAVEKLRNEALHLWLLYDYGDASALPKLQDMAKQEGLDASVKHTVHKYVGYCYRDASSFDKAIEAFEIAVQVSQTEAERAGDIVEIAKCLHKMKQQPDGLKRIMHCMSPATLRQIGLREYPTL